MSVKALVELRQAIVSARYSDHLRRFPGHFNLYKAVFSVFHAGYRRGRESVFAQTAPLMERKTRARRATDAIRFMPARLSRLLEWGVTQFTSLYCHGETSNWSERHISYP